MPGTRFVPIVLALSAVALFAGCGSDSSDEESTGATTTVTAADCTPESLGTFKAGVLTVGTDSPAYPPYFEDDDPTNGKGFESAVAYAIADRLGFGASQVEWTTVPFNASYAPGPKKFDFDVNQISITPPREKVVDFSDPYYNANQAVLVAKGSDLADINSLDELKDAKIGVQIGTTSLDDVNAEIDPSTEPRVYDNSNDVVTALKVGQVDAIVVDLPTAIYLRDAELPGSSVAGQFAGSEGDQWGALLQKESELTPCINFALQNMVEDGTLDEITKQWMSDAADAPELN
ncbi:MAG: ABC transporter substrate-binding protein [Solirubrobacterales bacterium]